MKKKRWAIVYPNYGQSAGHNAFKKLLTAAQPDVEFVAEQATPLARWTPAAWCRRWLMQALTPSSTCCSPPISPFVREGNTRGLFQGRGVSQPAHGRIRAPGHAAGRDAAGLVVTGYPWYAIFTPDHDALPPPIASA